MKKLYRILVVVLVLLLAVTVLVACDSHEHNYDQTGSDAKGHWNYCKEDNAIDEDSRAAHDYTVVKNDENYHWKECSCGYKNNSSIASHADENKDGKCDGCGFAMPLPKDEYIGIKEIDGVPTLVVEGPMPEGVECIKLHYEANNAHTLIENSSTDSLSFVFNVPLNTLPTEDTPWCFFHIYTYSVANPSDADKEQSINLDRKEWINAGATYKYNYVSYEIQNESQLVIQPKPYYAEINSIKLEEIESKPYLVVKGSARQGVAYVNLHVDHENINYYSEYTSMNGSDFETRFDLSQCHDGAWMYFHVYVYDEKPTNNDNKDGKFDLLRTTLMPAGTSLTVGDRRYITMGDYDGDTWNMVVVYKTTIPAYDVTSITVDGNNLVVSGVASANVEKKVLRLHANDGDDNVYGEFATIAEDNTFELKLDLSQLTKIDGGYWFHVYLYDSVDSENKSTDFDLASYLYSSDILTTIGEVKLTVIKNEKTWSVFKVKPVNAE